MLRSVPLFSTVRSLTDYNPLYMLVKFSKHENGYLYIERYLPLAFMMDLGKKYLHHIVCLCGCSPGIDCLEVICFKRDCLYKDRAFPYWFPHGSVQPQGNLSSQHDTRRWEFRKGPETQSFPRFNEISV